MNPGKFLQFITFLTFLISCSRTNNSYYIDAVNGNDFNSGISPENAWLTLDNLGKIRFQPGVRILLCGGETFFGNVHLKNIRGDVDKNIVISSYGTGRATIDSKNGEAFFADSCSFLTIRNLNFKGSGRKDGNYSSGVVIKKGHNILIDSLDISGFQKAGIKISDSENIQIIHAHAFENGFAGILTGETYYEPYQLLSKNIYLGYCVAENNPGDPTVLKNHSGNGILISGTDSAVVEYCLAKNNGWDQPWEGNRPVGIWAFHSNNVTIQHCISCNNKSNPKGWDGGGFDFDGGVTNSVMQYNLSYNNEGPGYGLFQYWGAAKWENNIIRYNVGINDGTRHDGYELHIWNGQPDNPIFQNARIYNNVFYNDSGRALDYNSVDVPGIYYWNNIFISKQQPVVGEHSKSVFENNLYWRISDFQVDFTNDSLGIFANPLLIMPGISNINLEDPTKLSEMDFFKPLKGSPAIGNGKPLNESGGFDFAGNPLNGDLVNINLGVWQ